jgi:putative nucleotidyltransferase with HDIG domain
MNSADQQIDTGYMFISDLAYDLNNGTLDLPAFPDVALQIKTALEDSEMSAEKVAKLISSDPVFSARILKLANSVMVNGAGHTINDIHTAITRMGFNMAYNTAISIAFDQLKSKSAPAHIVPYLEECWHHSVQVAAYSYVIAKKLSRINPDSALLAGLLHDIGKYYILSRAENYPDIINSSEALDAILHEWHTGIGRGILEAWSISEEICTVADEHEELVRHSKFVDLTDIVMVANLFSHREDKVAASDIEWDSIPATQKLKLSEKSAIEVINESEEEIRSIINALECC